MNGANTSVGDGEVVFYGDLADANVMVTFDVVAAQLERSSVSGHSTIMVTAKFMRSLTCCL